MKETSLEEIPVSPSNVPTNNVVFTETHTPLQKPDAIETSNKMQKTWGKIITLSASIFIALCIACIIGMSIALAIFRTRGFEFSKLFIALTVLRYVAYCGGVVVGTVGILSATLKRNSVQILLSYAYIIGLTAMLIVELALYFVPFGVEPSSVIPAQEGYSIYEPISSIVAQVFFVVLVHIAIFGSCITCAAIHVRILHGNRNLESKQDVEERVELSTA